MRILALLLMVVMTQAGLAEDLYDHYKCEKGFIRAGMTMQQVHDLCGQFDDYQVWDDQYTDLNVIDSYGRAPVVKDRYDRWTYKAQNKFAVHVIFKNGKVVKLVRGGR